MNDTKPIWQSSTFYGALMMLASTAAMFFKVDLGDQTLWVNAITGLVGSVVAIIGRVKAVKRIG